MTRQIKGPGTEVLARDYIYSDPPPSIDDIAAKYHLARSNVASKATAGKWADRRKDFRRRVAEDTRDAMAEKWAEERIAVYERLAKMAITYFDLYEKALSDGEVKVSTRDMLGVAAMIRTLTGDMAELSTGSVVVDPTTGEIFDGTAEEARAAIENVKALMAGKKEADGE